MSKAAILSAYRDGVSPSLIAERFGVHVGTVQRYRKAAGIPTQRKQPAKYRRLAELDQEADKLKTLWADGCSVSEIARRTPFTRKTIAKWLQGQGIEPVPRRRKGPDHRAWKGGVKMVKGYRAVKVPGDSPYASMADPKGYVLEHRLVMAAFVGRPLTRKETVHHIDGDKVNNYIENLQLRSGNHGPGQTFRCADCGSCNVEPVAL